MVTRDDENNYDVLQAAVFKETFFENERLEPEKTPAVSFRGFMGLVVLLV